MVLAFHHNPTAMSGLEGTAISKAACAHDNTTSTASVFECRKTPVNAAMALLGSGQCSQLIEDGAARRRAQLDHAKLNRIRLRRRRSFIGRAHASGGERAAAESDHLTVSCHRFQIRPLAAANPDLLVGTAVVEISARRRSVSEAVVFAPHRECAPHL